MSELINLSLTDQILGLADKSFSSKEITGAYLNEIKKKESLNCFISVFEEESDQRMVRVAMWAWLRQSTSANGKHTIQQASRMRKIG